MVTALYPTPIGGITLSASDRVIYRLSFGANADPDSLPQRNALTDRAYQQLSEYFEGKRQSFSLPLAPQGTAFQQRVWEALTEIPYGKTQSYREIAEKIGCPPASRAVGNANHQNPLPIFIPCHRVILSDGRLGGYGGGLAVKTFLLQLEEKNSAKKL